MKTFLSDEEFDSWVAGGALPDKEPEEEPQPYRKTDIYKSYPPDLRTDLFAQAAAHYSELHDPLIWYNGELSIVRRTSKYNISPVPATVEDIAIILNRSTNYHKARGDDKPIDIPAYQVKQVFALLRGSDMIPHVDGVISQPALDKDGHAITSLRFKDTYLYNISNEYAAIKLRMYGSGLQSIQEDFQYLMSLFDGFPFDGTNNSIHTIDTASKTLLNVMAFIFTPYLKAIFPEMTTPLFLVRKQSMRHGGTTLSKILSYLTTGGTGGLVPVPNKEKWDLFIESTIASGMRVAIMDNAPPLIISDYLNMAITTTKLSYRKYYTQSMVTVHNNTVFLVNGNNTNVTSELGRRTIPILFRSPTDDDISNRFRPNEASLFQYLEDNRIEHTEIILSILSHWLQTRYPTFSPDQEFSSFSLWYSILLDLFDMIGVKGFMKAADREHDIQVIDEEAEHMTRLLSILADQPYAKDGGYFQTIDVFESVVDHLEGYGCANDDLRDALPRAAQNYTTRNASGKFGLAFGNYMRKRAASGRTYGGYSIEIVKFGKYNRYCINVPKEQDTLPNG